MSTPAINITKPPLVSDEVWAAYVDLMGRARSAEHDPEDRQFLEQIYAVAPELRELGR